MPPVRDGAQGLEARPADPREHIERLIAAQRCMLLDGATGTELAQRAGDDLGLDDQRWGVSALVDAPTTWSRSTAAT